MKIAVDLTSIGVLFCLVWSLVVNFGRIYSLCSKMFTNCDTNIYYFYTLLSFYLLICDPAFMYYPVKLRHLSESLILVSVNYSSLSQYVCLLICDPYRKNIIYSSVILIKKNTLNPCELLLTLFYYTSLRLIICDPYKKNIIPYLS